MGFSTEFMLVQFELRNLHLVCLLVGWLVGCVLACFLGFLFS